MCYMCYNSYTCYIFSSIKERNWLISKEICVLLFDVFNDVLKMFQKRKFLGEEIWRNALALESKKAQGIFGEAFILAWLSSAAFRLQNGVSDFF